MTDSIVFLGSCTYDPETRVILHQNGDKYELQPVQADLLEYLYSNPLSYFTNNALQEHVWKGKVVESTTIRTTISLLRKALGETSENKYIDSRRNSGYRFVASVKKPPSQHAKALTAISIFSFIAIIAFVLVFSSTPTVSPPQTLTTLVGQEVNGTASSGIFVFSHKKENSKYWHLYAKRIGDERYFQLTDGEHDDRRAAFSPSGKQLAFQRHDGKRCEIWVADFNSDMVGFDNQKVVFECPNEILSVAVDWMDKDNIFLSYTESVTTPYKIYQYNIISKELTPITQPPSSVQGDYYLTYSQSIKKLAYFRFVGNSRTEIWTYDPATGEHNKIFSTPVLLLSAAWIDDQTKLVFRTGNGELSFLDMTTTSVSKLMSSSNAIRYPFTFGENQVGYMRGVLRARDIIQIDERGEQEIHVSSSFSDYLPTYANGSGDLVFVSLRSGRPQIWLLDAIGDMKQVSKFDNFYKIADVAISENSKWIAFTINTRIHVVDDKGDTIYVSDSETIHKNPSFSLDEKTLYYAVYRQNEWKIESIDLVSKHKEVLTNGYIAKPCINEDCLYIANLQEEFLYKYSGDKVLKTNIRLEEPQHTHQMAVLEDSIYFLKQSKNHSTLMRYDFDSQSTQNVFDIPSGHFSINPTNKSVFVSTYREPETILETINIEF